MPDLKIKKANNDTKDLKYASQEQHQTPARLSGKTAL